MRALASFFAAVVLGGCSGDIHRLDTPAVSPAASGLIDPVLPKSATDIYYLEYAAGLQDLERFVRFRVPTTELDCIVDDLIATNNREDKRSLAYVKTPLSGAPTSSPRSEFLPMTWWTPSLIRTGYYRGELDGYALRIWADSATGTVYIHQTD